MKLMMRMLMMMVKLNMMMMMMLMMMMMMLMMLLMMMMLMMLLLKSIFSCGETVGELVSYVAAAALLAFQLFGMWNVIVIVDETKK